MTPNHIGVALIDADGQAHQPEAGSAAALGETLAAGERRTVGLRFALPRGATPKHLLVTEGGPMTRFVLGDENSLLHRKVVFGLS